MIRFLFIISFIVFFISCSFATTVSSLDPSIADSSSIKLKEDTPSYSRLDSLWILEQLSAQQIEVDTNVLNKWSYSSDSIPLFEDSLIQARLSLLNEQTPFNLSYNRAVRTQINIYANTYRNHVSRMLGKANYYFTLFESILYLSLIHISEPTRHNTV